MPELTTNFDLTDEQKMIRDMIRDFAVKEVEPVAIELHRADLHVELDQLDHGLAGLVELGFACLHHVFDRH